MTVAGEPRGADELRRLWIPTIGDAQSADGWRAHSPHATYKPESTTALELPATVRDALASMPATLVDRVAGGSTPSGGSTSAAGTLSGQGTLADEAGVAATGPIATTGGFELIQEIGRGGMGVVFKARQRSLARDIAVKLIRPEQSSAASRGQFVAEALVNGLLDHPNIVPVHELGTSERGEAFLVMKLVGGTSWKDLLHPSTPAQRKLAEACDLERHLEILDGVCNAVAFAHSKGIVHRDLKPENVMVGAFGEVLVMDWGIAVDVRERPDADARARHKSTVRSPSGTPSYMPPELAEGRGGDIGPWTDTYLLGAILFEILAGHPPHRGDTLLAVLMAASASKPPTFPAGVSAGLAAICTRALARRIEDRYRSVAELQSALRDQRRHRESEKIAEAAAIAHGRAERGGDGGEAERARRYGDFAEAIAGYRQALVLWSDNARARNGERTTRIAYARAALAAGDVALARAQIPERVEGDAEFQQLAAEIQRVHAQRDRARAVAKRMRVGLIVLTGVVVVGLAAGLWIVVSEQLRNARLLGPQQRLQAELQGKLAAIDQDRALHTALLGTPDPDAVLLARGSAARTDPAPIGAELARALDAPESARLLDWSPDRSRALLLDGEDRVLVRDVVPESARRGPRIDLELAGVPVVAASLAANGTRAATADRGGSVQLWSIDTAASREGTIELGAAPDRIALDASGRRLAVASRGSITVWDVDARRATGDAQAIEGAVARLVFEGDALAIVGSDARGAFVARFDPRTRTIVGRRRLAAE